MIKLREAQLNRLPAQAKKAKKPDKPPKAQTPKKHEKPEREEAPAPGSMFDELNTDFEGVKDEK